MSEKEKRICRALAKALEAIPEEKKEYFLGFAEGVEAAMRGSAESEPTTTAGRAYPPGA